MPLSLDDRKARMTEPEQDELTEPGVTEVPEPDQEPHDPDEDPDENPDLEPEPEPESEPEARAAQQAEWEKRFNTADKRFATYDRNVKDLWADDYGELVQFVFSPSAPPGYIDKRDAGRLEGEPKRLLLEWLGFAQEQEYEPDPETRECGTCKGKGFTRTGSHVAGKEKRHCPTCHGSGAQGLVNVAQPEQGNGHKDEPFSLAEGVPAESADADNWGQPRILPDGRENPNWGRQPQYWIQVEPYGDTRDLTAQSVTA